MECLGRDVTRDWRKWTIDGQVAGMVKEWAPHLSLITVKVQPYRHPHSTRHHNTHNTHPAPRAGLRAHHPVVLPRGGVSILRKLARGRLMPRGRAGKKSRSSPLGI